MMRACKFVAGLFALLYAAALFLFLVGTFGWFGSPRGPLAGIFLVPLGLPWSLMLDWAPSEFSRLRAQYNRDNSRPGGADDQWSLQYIMSLGAHGAHAF